MEQKASAAPESSLQHPIERDEVAGMNPTNIITGIGLKGEKMRHVVHEGALRLPKSALAIMGPTLNPQATFRLPNIDSVARPSRDPSMAGMTVTEIHGVVLPADPVNLLPERLQCYARNRLWPKDILNPGPERMRGGGGEGGDDPPDEAMDQNPAPEASASTAEEGKESESSNVQAMDTSGSEPVPKTTADEPVGRNVPAVPQQNPVSVPSSGPPSDPLPASVSSAGNVATSSTRSLPEVIPLATKPESQWQQHAPNPLDAVPDGASGSSVPDWFKPIEVSAFEQSLLSEWFDGSAVHRNEKSYLASRNRMMDMSKKLSNRNVTATMIRRSIPGDVGSLMRLYSFLTAHGLINANALNDTAPTPVTLQESKAKYRWSEPLQQELLHAVVEESCKRRKVKDPPSNTFEPVVDWEAVATQVGHGVTATDCERQFLAMPIADTSAERAITPDVTVTSGPKVVDDVDDSAKSKIAIRQELMQDLLDRSDAHVVRAAVDVALLADHSGNLHGAQLNAQAGIITHQARQQAKSSEGKISRIMAEVVDLRMKKLENRLAVLDDVEGLLESERAALELERRDLYTARCRHWFGGA